MRLVKDIEAQITECDRAIRDLDDQAEWASPRNKAVLHKWLDSWKSRRGRLLEERGRVERAFPDSPAYCHAVASRIVGESGGL